jgi:hypothetical protein
MSWIHGLGIISGIALTALLFYAIFPRKRESKVLLQSFLFAAMLGYLGVDYFLKEKFGFVLILFLGAVAFVVYVKNSPAKKE